MRRKLIEVALPLEAINQASAKEKSIRHGHPSTLHLWWARRPLATCRAVLFSQLVDDPSSHPDKFPDEASQAIERERLFAIIQNLVRWENLDNELVQKQALAEIKKSNPDGIPIVYDPFSGGGSIPLEAQRLGLPAFGSDLNPVAVMIGKALIELPHAVKNREPINPEADSSVNWKNLMGLADDVHYYGKKILENAKAKLHKNYSFQEEETVIAWLWARAVFSPNPQHREKLSPLVSTFKVLDHKGVSFYLKPCLSDEGVRFEILSVDGKRRNNNLDIPKNGTKLGRGANFSCIYSGDPITPEYIKQQGVAGSMKTILLAKIIQKEDGKRVVKEITSADLECLENINPKYDTSSSKLPHDPRNFWTIPYGIEAYDQLHSPRQTKALEVFSDEIKLVIDEIGSENGEYEKALAVYLSFVLDRCVNYWSMMTPWSGSFISQTMSRQALPMVWDFAEANPFSGNTGSWANQLDWVCRVLKKLTPNAPGEVMQLDASEASTVLNNAVISTDPPYYDNISYAELSDFFYVWMRRNLRSWYPDLFKTILVPKDEELIAHPYRQGGKIEAESHFLNGMTSVMRTLNGITDKNFPMAIYYAFKAKEIKEEGLISTGWATFLHALIDSGLKIVATWPVRTERAIGLKGSNNFLASSIVLVARPREANSRVITRSEFVRLLKNEMPKALEKMLSATIAPVDLAQSAIGPGIGIFSRYSAVLEADDSQMSVKTALSLVNEAIDEILTEQEGEYDDDTRFAISWYEQFAEDSGEYGLAETLANARGVSVQGVVNAGILSSSGGKVRLLKRNELQNDWTPETDDRLTVWEATQYLIRWHEEGGDSKAADLLARLGNKAMDEPAKALAYRLYKICEDKGWSDLAQSYNNLVQMWSDLKSIGESVTTGGTQAEMDL